MRKINTTPRGQIFKDKHTSTVFSSVPLVASVVHPVFTFGNMLTECKANGSYEVLQNFTPCSA